MTAFIPGQRVHDSQGNSGTVTRGDAGNPTWVLVHWDEDPADCIVTMPTNQLTRSAVSA